MKKQVIVILSVIAISLVAAPPVNSEAKMHTRSTVIEKERPELDEETRRLISEFRRNPTEENRQARERTAEILVQSADNPEHQAVITIRQRSEAGPQQLN